MPQSKQTTKRWSSANDRLLNWPSMTPAKTPAVKWIEPCGNDFTPSQGNKSVCAKCGWSKKKHICNCGCGLGLDIHKGE